MKNNINEKFLLKTILRFGIPSIFTMWIYSLYTIVDGIFIGKYLGSNAIAAVNIVMPFVNFSFALGIMIAIGSGTMITINLGRGLFNKANKIYSTGIEILFILGGFLGIIGIFFNESIVKLLGASDLIAKFSQDYLFTISWFTVFYLLSYGFEIFIRIDGNPTYSMFCNLCGAFINIILDYIFIIHFNWGIKGAGFATGLAQFTVSILMLIYLKKHTNKFKFSFEKIELYLFKNICFKGSSEFLTEVTTGIVIATFNINIMKTIGENGLSAFGIIGYISTIVTMTMIGFSQGLQPIISYCLGSKKFHTIKKIMKIGIIIVFSLGVLFYLLINIFSNQIIDTFISNNDYLHKVANDAIRLYSFTYILLGINIIISSYFTAIENPIISSTLSLLRGIIIINTLLYILPIFLENNGIWLSAPLNEIFTLFFSVFLFIKFRNKKLN